MSDLSAITAQPWEIQHDGKTYRVQYLSFDIITKFSNWLKMETLKEIERWREIDPQEYELVKQDFRQAVLERRFQWGGTAVRAAFDSTDGIQELLKYCVAIKDGDFRQLNTDEVLAIEKGHPVQIAIEQIFEESLGPKALWKQEQQAPKK